MQEIFFLGDSATARMPLDELTKQSGSWHAAQRQRMEQRWKAQTRLAVFYALLVICFLMGLHIYYVKAGVFDGVGLALCSGAYVFFLCAVGSARNLLRIKRLRYRLSPLEFHESNELAYLEGVCPEAAHWAAKRERALCKADLEWAQELHENSKAESD